MSRETFLRTLTKTVAVVALYKVTKQLSDQNNTYIKQARDKGGTVKTTEREQAARLVLHFKEVLNRPEPNKSASPDPFG